MKPVLQVTLFLFFSYTSLGQATRSVQFSNAIISRWTTTPVSGRVCIDKMTSKGWEYSNSIVLHGIEKVYNRVTDAAYLTYIKTYVDDYVNASGVIAPADMAQNLDKIHPGILILFLYEKYKSTSATDSLRYRTAATYLRNYLIEASSAYPKTSEGGYYHKNTAAYTDVMMLDGIYMAHPFLAKYGKIFNDNTALDIASGQVLLLASHLHNTTNHLAYHAYDHARTRTWANSSTGVSYEVWSRGMGWYVMALVDILKYLPSTHSNYNAVKAVLADLAIGIQNTQDASTGLWYQVVDKGGSVGNYLETSGSAMFIYALKVAADSGWINSSFLTVAQNGWTGLQTKITTAGDAMPQINDFAPAMGVQGTSAANAYSSYVAITSVDCPGSVHPHGYAAILMAASVMEYPLVVLPVKFLHLSARQLSNDIQLSWENADENNVAHYEIQRSQTGNGFVTAGTVRSTGSFTYNWVDKNIVGNRLYYRIRAVSINGTFDYSSVISITRNNKAPDIQVLSNPVKENIVTISISNMNAGVYKLTMLDCLGKIIKQESTTISDVNSIVTQNITLPSTASKGLYYLQISGTGVAISKKILID